MSARKHIHQTNTKLKVFPTTATPPKSVRVEWVERMFWPEFLEKSFGQRSCLLLLFTEFTGFIGLSFTVLGPDNVKNS